MSMTSLSSARALAFMLVGSFGLASMLGACAAPVESEATAASSEEAIILKCPARYTHDCETDPGPTGKPLITCTPCEPIATYWTEVVGGSSANTFGFPDGPVQQTLYNLGCTVPVIDQEAPIFACPISAHAQLPYYIDWYGYPACGFSADGQQLKTNGGDCETVWTTTNPVALHANGLGTLVSGYEWVWVMPWENTDETGRGCTASCAQTPKPTPVMPPPGL
jgi:hypothetical protein